MEAFIAMDVSKLNQSKFVVEADIDEDEEMVDESKQVQSQPTQYEAMQKLIMERLFSQVMRQQ